MREKTLTATVEALDLTALTPPEMDELFIKAWMNESRWQTAVERYTKLVNDGGGYYQANLDEAREEFRVARAELKTLEAEWDRRGGWNRYPLVVNHDGHVHRNMHCSTTFPTTQWTLVTALSGMTENEMVENVGHMACTVCFPNAPVHPHFIQTLKDAEADAAAKKNALCEGSGQYAKQDVRRGYSTYATCHVCGRRGVSVTRGHNLRGHKTPEAENAERLAAVNSDPKKILAADGSMLRGRYCEIKTVISAWRELVGDLDILKLYAARNQEATEYRESVERITAALAAKLDTTADDITEQADKKLAAKRKRERG